MSALLDLREAAARLGVDYETARKYTAAGLLRAVRLPSLGRPGSPRRRIQVREEDLEAFIRSSLTVPDEDPVALLQEEKPDPSKRRVGRTKGKGKPYEWCK